MRRSISILLIVAITTLLVLFVSGGLWGLLAAVGDRAAAQGAKGVALTALACWAISFVGLVLTLAVAWLKSNDE